MVDRFLKARSLKILRALEPIGIAVAVVALLFQLREFEEERPIRQANAIAFALQSLDKLNELPNQLIQTSLQTILDTGTDLPAVTFKNRSIANLSLTGREGSLPARRLLDWNFNETQTVGLNLRDFVDSDLSFSRGSIIGLQLDHFHGSVTVREANAIGLDIEMASNDDIVSVAFINSVVESSTIGAPNSKLEKFKLLFIDSVLIDVEAAGTLVPSTITAMFYGGKYNLPGASEDDFTSSCELNEFQRDIVLSADDQGIAFRIRNLFDASSKIALSHRFDALWQIAYLDILDLSQAEVDPNILQGLVDEYFAVKDWAWAYVWQASQFAENWRTTSSGKNLINDGSIKLGECHNDVVSEFIRERIAGQMKNEVDRLNRSREEARN